MKRFFKLFKIYREERRASIIVLSLLAFFHFFFVRDLWGVFSTLVDKNYGNTIIKHFHMSGFDPITYNILIKWHTGYNVHRHPFLAFIVWPFSMLNDWLTTATGLNLMQIVAAVPLIFCALYSFLFLFRILHRIVGLSHKESMLLSGMYFSFGYVMASIIVPDHFCISMFLLLAALYISGMLIQKGQRLKVWQTILLFLFTAGVTLSNGIKIFIDALFVNRKHFFNPKYWIPAVMIPAMFIWWFARWEYRIFVLPKQKARWELQEKKQEERKQHAYIAFKDTTTLKDTAEIRYAFETQQKLIADQEAKRKEMKMQKKFGKPIGNGEFERWTDISTPRMESLIENVFGESILLHEQYLLKDALRSRPTIVGYGAWWVNYIVESVIVLLFILGLWFGRHSRFLWMVMAGVCVDAFIHIVLGFGLNEIYIMTAHWAFCIPIAIAFLLKSATSTCWHRRIFLLLLLLATYLFLYNGILIIGYLN